MGADCILIKRQPNVTESQKREYITILKGETVQSFFEKQTFSKNIINTVLEN
jgi:hypothetical protein